MSKTTVKREYYDDGQLEYEYQYKDDKMHGVGKNWYKDGQLYYKATYREGEAHGFAKWWDRNGKLLRIHHYLYGRQVLEEEFRKHQIIEKLAGL